MNEQAKTWKDYCFCLVIGTMYIYALSSFIFGATIIRTGGASLVIAAIISIFIFMIVLYNRYTFFITLGALILYGGRLLFSLRDDYLHPVLDHFNRMGLMIMGMAPFNAELSQTVVWLVSLLLGAVVVFFMFDKYNFFVLAAVGIAVVAGVWLPGFVRDDAAFLLFLFVFVVLFIRHMNRAMAIMIFIIPLCAVVIWLANVRLPSEHEIFEPRPIDQLQGPVDAVSDRLFEIFNPTYFSFQSTGFGGPGGRLGGAVTVNNRPVMTVQAPGGTYLAGATSNIYTGYSWVPSLYYGQINTHGLPPGQFEMIETAASLMRNATIAYLNERLSSVSFWNAMNTNDARISGMHNFHSLGVEGNPFFAEYFLHSYLPFSNVTVGIGRQRTGTIFRPNRAWDLVFNPVGNDYLLVTTMFPTGDMQTPSMMSRDATYHFQFLNVNDSLGFMQPLLQATNQGVYSRSFSHYQLIDSILHEQVTFGGSVAPLSWSSADTRWLLITHPEAFAAAHRDGFWFDSSLDFGEPDELDEDDYAIEDEDILDDEYELRMYDVVLDLSWHAHTFLLSELAAAAEEFSQQLALELEEEIAGITPQHIMEIIEAFRNPNVTTVLESEWALVRVLDAFSREVLAQYANEVRANFLQVPDITPQRVHDLTMAIVEGKTNDFDRVMAIRNYLLQLPYTLDTVPVPPGVCFVDHFLFNTRQGYCTYFASAMAIMSRIAGVPSRYVEGFVLPPSREAMPTVTVTNRMAHAWVEVYLEGSGWLLVEATPTYALIFDPSTPIPLQNIASTGFDDDWLRAIAEGMAWDHEDEMRDWMDLLAGGTTPSGAGAATTVAAEEPIETVNRLWYLWLTPLLIPIGFLVFLFVRYLQVKQSIKKVQKLQPSQQVIRYFNGIMDIVAYHTTPIAQGETPQLYGKHKGKRFAFRSDSVFLKDLIQLYYKAKYAKAQVSEEERALMEEAYFDMLRFLQQVKRRPQVLYLRYVKGLAGL